MCVIANRNKFFNLHDYIESPEVSSYSGPMNSHRRKFLELFGLSYFSVILMPYNLLYSANKKIINPNLTKEQKNHAR